LQNDGRIGRRGWSNVKRHERIWQQVEDFE
jgi:hypothetical protein